MAVSEDWFRWLLTSVSILHRRGTLASFPTNEIRGQQEIRRSQYALHSNTIGLTLHCPSRPHTVVSGQKFQCHADSWQWEDLAFEIHFIGQTSNGYAKMSVCVQTVQVHGNNGHSWLISGPLLSAEITTTQHLVQLFVSWQGGCRLNFSHCIPAPNILENKVILEFFSLKCFVYINVLSCWTPKLPLLCILHNATEHTGHLISLCLYKIDSAFFPVLRQICSSRRIKDAQLQFSEVELKCPQKTDEFAFFSQTKMKKN